MGSVVLLAATMLSLYLANSESSHAWLHLWETHFGPAALGLHLSLKEWVNEGLMAIFFFVVGVDIKKEFVYGSLSSIRKAVLPCLGALGGMVVPMVSAENLRSGACPFTKPLPPLPRTYAGCVQSAEPGDARGRVGRWLGGAHGHGHRLCDGRLWLFQVAHAGGG